MATKRTPPKPPAKPRKPAAKPKNSAATRELIAKGRQYYVPNYKPREMIIDRGKGSKVWDLEGNDYLDFGSGIAVAGLGHANRDLIRALTKQAEKIWHTSNIFYTEPPVRLAEELVKASKFAKRVFFCNSGGEANEAAIKLARKTAADKGKPPEQRNIITFHGSFHGRTLATVTATAQPKYQQGFEPLPGGFKYCAFNDFEAISRMMDDSVCAVLIETVQGEGGVMPVKPDFLKHIESLCRKHGALLMIDDVQAGMGRTGKLFSHFWEGVTPDVVTLAKGLGGGIPIGAMLVGERASEVFQFGSHGTTFGGNPLATAVAREVLRHLQSKELMSNVAARSKQLMSGLATVGKDYKGFFREIRGRGLMIGAELHPQLHGKAGDITEFCRKAGVMVLQAGPNVLRFVPALTITEREVEQGLKRLRKGLDAFLDAERRANVVVKLR